MTVGDLQRKLAPFKSRTPVLVRCEWEGDEPVIDIFEPMEVKTWVEPDTADECVVIVCAQDTD